MERDRDKVGEGPWGGMAGREGRTEGGTKGRTEGGRDGEREGRKEGDLGEINVDTHACDGACLEVLDFE